MKEVASCGNLLCSLEQTVAPRRDIAKDIGKENLQTKQNCTKSKRVQDQLHDVHKAKDKEIKRRTRKYRRKHIETLAEEAHQTANREVLNCPKLNVMANPEPLANDIRIDTGTLAFEEVIKAIKTLKTGKAPGVDSVHVETLKGDIDTSSKVIHNLLSNIWEDSFPSD
ncbi:unnamed protein product [Mytilus coruscus]|uniref:Reverse transcriptase domain-containing protein n=1 Tax=Mytilus coruscus TaxID=42192 RepID=A0A6J8DPA6_MYTCO|nr:unnamed protein product [Mytilus coruscus]